jgi:NAD(P)-dependent dehydrogenase (short-subunit alcohol dehydrogenase family)
VTEGGRDRAAILITGTSSGIGLLSAVELSRRGARVFASMRDTTRSDVLLSAAEEAGVGVELVALDVTSESSVRDAVAHVVAKAGRLDVVVNNAAVFAVGPIELAGEQDVETIFQTNIIGVIRVVRCVLPVMRRQRSGRIVNVGSACAEPRIGIPLTSLYGATKAALHALTLDINKELAPLGIRSVLCEGGIGGHTPMVRTYHDCVDAFGGAGRAYAKAELLARRVGEFLDASDDLGHEAALIIADACTTPSPAVRYPLEAQAEVDQMHAISDQDYLGLCRGQNMEEILGPYGAVDPVWTILSAEP